VTINYVVYHLSDFLYIFFWSGVAVDGPGKDHTANISLYKKTGKVKALDEEIYSMLTCQSYLLSLKCFHND